MKGSPLEWVYFQVLTHDAMTPKVRPELGQIFAEGYSAINGANGASNYASKVGNNGTALLNMAQAELAKEQALLSQIFGVSLNIDFSKKNAIKDLIDTLNCCLNLKSVYERNKALMLSNKKGVKGVFSYFNTYLLQAYDQRREEIKKQVIEKFMSGADFYSSVHSILEEEFNNIIIEDAINRMLSARTERGVNKKYRDAYKEILLAIKKFPRNPLSEGLKRAWGINSLIDDMTEEIVNNGTSKAKLKKSFNKYQMESTVDKNGNKKRVRHNVPLRNLIYRKYSNHATGLSLEALEDQIIAMIVGDFPSIDIGSENFRIKSTVTAGGISQLGYKKARADNAVYFNADGSKIDQMINEMESEARMDAVNTFNKIGHYIEGIKDGFIVYESAKNYELGKDFGGYSAGAAISLRNLEGVLGKFLSNVKEISAVLVNAGSGAINAGDTGEVSKVLAQAIAFALFDDWDTIGNVSSGGQSIHIMNLSGVLVPLSAMLYSLGEAINNVQKSYTSFVTVSITKAKYDTSYPTRFLGMRQWEEVYNQGLDNTKISYEFMQNIASFLKF